jgi:acyl-CoA thioesterase
MVAGLSRVLATVQPGGSVKIGAEWLQGKATFGGLSAAICLQAVLKQGFTPELPPLRSAQISFVGTVGGDATVSVAALRRGRSMDFIGADVHDLQDGTLGTRATFCFGAARQSQFDEVMLPAPPTDLPRPDEAEDFFSRSRPELAPNFAQNFDARLARGAWPVSGSTCSDHWLWVRHKGCDGAGNVDGAAHAAVSLLALADMPPPAMMAKFAVPRPVSSLTWLVNLLDVRPQSVEGGWYLLRQRADHASQGYSSQDMLVYGQGGRPVLAGRQSVGIYA